MVEIATVVGMSPPTLRKIYLHELETGHVVANAAVAQSLFKQATHPTNPCVRAAIFWLKTRARWVEAVGPEEPGKKLAADLLSRVAEQNTGWDGLLAKHPDDNPEKPRRSRPT